MILLTTRFLAELAGVAALAYWGATSFPMPGALVAAVCAPLVLIVAWALVAAPNATNRLSQRTRGLVGTALLVVVSAALASAGQPAAGSALAVIVLVDQALLIALDPQLPASLAGGRG